MLCTEKEVGEADNGKWSEVNFVDTGLSTVVGGMTKIFGNKKFKPIQDIPIIMRIELKK